MVQVFLCLIVIKSKQNQVVLNFFFCYSQMNLRQSFSVWVLIVGLGLFFGHNRITTFPKHVHAWAEGGQYAIALGFFSLVIIELLLFRNTFMLGQKAVNMLLRWALLITDLIFLNPKHLFSTHNFPVNMEKQQLVVLPQ